MGAPVFPEALIADHDHNREENEQNPSKAQDQIAQQALAPSEFPDNRVERKSEKPATLPLRAVIAIHGRERVAEVPGQRQHIENPNRDPDRRRRCESSIVVPPKQHQSNSDEREDAQRPHHRCA